jgi:hypothetical protein
MTTRGTAAEGILLKMLLEHGIEAEHGSPSRPGDIIIPPNVIIEIKDPKEKSYSFMSHSAKGAKQWSMLKEKKERFPWLEIYYVIRFSRKEWRYFLFPEAVKPLRLKDGKKLENLFADLLVSQNHFAIAQGGGK